MAQISVNSLTFRYEGSFDNIFDNVSFSLDTSWKLGLIGRNGKGKTTLLNLLLGKYDYKGTISTNSVFDYFPYFISEELKGEPATNFIDALKPGCEEWRVICEMDRMSMDAEALYRPFSTLSFGERTKIMLAILFSGENDFLLIDEPSNHLDQRSREIVKTYLSSKNGFILVSHDRDLLDACVDHVLVMNRSSIVVQQGNFTSWWTNKERADHFAKAENEKHLKEISKLKAAADRATRWAEKNENTKIGFDPVREHDRMIDTRCHIGTKTKKMQSRAKSYEIRMNKEIADKENLLADIEEPVNLKLTPLIHYKSKLIRVSNYCLKYNNANSPVFKNLSFEISQGERVFLRGENGCGKSSVILSALSKLNYPSDNPFSVTESGTFEVTANLVISYISQDTSQLRGFLSEFSDKNGLDYSLFLSLLRQLDFDRTQFEKRIEDYSEGQKKKVLIAFSLMTPAHLYIWDEPLNYVDVFSRMQIEKLIMQYQPTMLVVEHDICFSEQIATSIIDM